MQTVHCSGLSFCATKGLPAGCRADPGMAGARHDLFLQVFLKRGKYQIFFSGTRAKMPGKRPEDTFRGGFDGEVKPILDPGRETDHLSPSHPAMPREPCS